MTYSPGQLEVIYPFLPAEPRWLVLAGPADANEAQTARERWPAIKVLGIEPNVAAIRWQRENGWPEDAPLLHAALGDRESFYDIWGDEPLEARNFQMVRELVGKPFEQQPDREKDLPVTRIPVTMLDMLDAVHGPFEDAVVWMDIEGAEWMALQGGKDLLYSRRVLLWNIEVMDYNVEAWKGVIPLMKAHGYVKVHQWNDSATCKDMIFVRAD